MLPYRIFKHSKACSIVNISVCVFVLCNEISNTYTFPTHTYVEDCVICVHVIELTTN